MRFLLKEVPGSSPKSIFIREGIERSTKEVARDLSTEMGFDLEGAYKTGYNSEDVVEYLIAQPHSLSISFYKGKYYENRLTVLYIIPFSVCIILFIIGAAILIFKWKK